MKFLKLEIKNLASLDREEGEVIDFEAGVLKDSTIFSIVGPTGSGKSTLLDAICLALYNRAPRYPKKGREKSKIEIYGTPEEGEKNRIAPTDCRNILSRGKKLGYSKLTFRANNGDVYRAEWHVVFKNKNYANDSKPQLFKITSKDGYYVEEKADWDTLPQIIGLDYEQFLRTVLIAQGSFADFLNADVEDRYKLLEKLVGSEQLYSDIASRIKAQTTDAVTAYTTVNADFAAFEKDIIPEDELNPLQAKIGELEEKEQKAKEELGQITIALQWFTDENQYLTNLEKYKNEKTLAENAKQQAQAQFDRLALHDATLQATNWYKEFLEASHNITMKTDEMNQIAEGVEKKQSDIEQGEKYLAVLKKNETDATQALNDLKPHLDRARTIKGELAEARKSLTEKTAEKTQCERNYNKAQKDYTGSTGLAGKTPAEVVESTIAAFNTESQKTEGVNASQLQKATSDAEQRKSDIREAIRIQRGMAEKRKKIQDNAYLRTTKTTRKNQIADELQKLQIGTLEAELQTLHSTHTLMTSNDWTLHRSHLEEGAPCPLCGAKEHPYKSEAVLAPVVNDLQKLIEEKKETLNKQRETKSKLGKEQGEIDGILKGLDTSDQTLNKDLANLQNDWVPVHQRNPEWVEDAATLEALQPTIDREAALAAEAFNNYNTAVDNINKLRAIKDSGMALLNATETWNKADAKVKEKVEAIKNEIGDKDPDTLEQELNEAKNKATEAVNAQNKAIGKLREVQEGLKGRQEITQKAIEDETKKRDERTRFLRQWLATYNSSHEQQLTGKDIAALYSAIDNWEDIRRWQGQLNTTLTQTTTTYNNEVNKHTQHQEKKPSKTQEELTARKTELEQLSNQELTDAKARLQRHTAAKEKMGELFQQRQEAERLKTDWENISKAIGVDGKTLRKIAQCYTLRFLIEHANAEIRKFNSRYELVQVKNSLGIRVIDHDRADDVRDTTSLSGGETFIVSLGLALGLSSLSSRNISFENLFIDEGFGTLDPDTLATVIDSLAMLQSSQGKKVGVISHTDTMSERITTQIRIIKNGNSGSSHIEIHP